MNILKNSQPHSQKKSFWVGLAIFFPLASLLHLPALGQEPDKNYDYERFLAEFNKEMMVENQKTTEQYPKPLKLMLPSWFNEPLLDSTLGYTISCGISDAGRDTTDSKSQAILRALAFTSICNSTESSFVTDNFQKEMKYNMDAKFAELYRFTSHYWLDTKRIKILNRGRFENGESIVQLNYKPIADSLNSPKNMLVNVFADLYHIEAIVDGYPQNIIKLSFITTLYDSITESKQTDNFSLFYVNQRWVSSSSLFNGREVTTNAFKYFYSLPDSSASKLDNCSKMACTTFEGLFPSLISDLLWQLSGKVIDQATTSKRLNEQYNGSMTTLIRESDYKKIRFQIKRISLYNNRLHSEIQFVN